MKPGMEGMLGRVVGIEKGSSGNETLGTAGIVGSGMAGSVGIAPGFGRVGMFGKLGIDGIVGRPGIVGVVCSN